MLNDSLFRYVHSYQSYLWNNAASIRVQKYGMCDVSSSFDFNKIRHPLLILVILFLAGADRVVVGDLVYCKEDSGKEVVSNNTECGDDISDEADNGSDLVELPEVDLPHERNLPVKVG